MHRGAQLILERMQTHPHEFMRTSERHDVWMGIFRRYRRFLDEDSKQLILERYRVIQLDEMFSSIRSSSRASGADFLDGLEASVDARSAQEEVILQLDIAELESVVAPTLYQRLQRSSLWPLYERHFKKYSKISKFLNYCLRIFSRISAQVGGGKRRRIVSLADFVPAERRICLLAGASVETPPPKANPPLKQSILIAPHLSYSAPEVFAAEVSDAVVVGGTNIVFKDGFALCHDLYNFELDATSEELHGQHKIFPKQQKLKWVNSGYYPTSGLSDAAVFLDACASNYAHWLTEVLPRIAVFALEPRYRNVPILVDGSLHQNLMESLAVVCGSRKVVLVPPRTPIHVKRLIVTSVAGYVPWGRRNEIRTGHSHGIFNPRALTALVNAVKEKSVLSGGVDKRWPQKIYLKRSSGGRKLVNEAEVLAILEPHGYVSVDTARLTFQEQASLFAQATHIVGVSGSALANLVFATPEAKIDIIISEFPGTSYWYWQNIACATGKTVRYTFGTPSGTDLGIHSDLFVNLADIRLILRDVESSVPSVR